MSEPGQILSTSTNDRIEACVLDFERNPPRPPGEPPSRNPYRPPIRGILLQDLPSEGTAQCAVSSRKPDAFIQKFAIIGEITNQTKFALAFGTAKTDFLPYSVSAADLRTALEKLSTIGKGNVSVAIGGTPAVAATGGNPAVSAMNPGVWLITFIGKFLIQTGNAAPAPPPLMTFDDTKLTGLGLLQITSTVWGDTGTIEPVNDAIPVGTPTPMRKGAVAWAQWMPGAGFCVTACEGREFSVLGE